MNSAFLSLFSSCAHWMPENDMTSLYDEKSEQKDVASKNCNNVIHINKLNIGRSYINILKLKQGLFMQILYESSYYLALLILHVQWKSTI